ncbi:MAG: hypothetical protein U0414_23870 [Polyangiaceae bacterium]
MKRSSRAADGTDARDLPELGIAGLERGADALERRGGSGGEGEEVERVGARALGVGLLGEDDRAEPVVEARAAARGPHEPARLELAADGRGELHGDAEERHREGGASGIVGEIGDEGRGAVDVAAEQEEARAMGAPGGARGDLVELGGRRTGRALRGDASDVVVGEALEAQGLLGELRVMRLDPGRGDEARALGVSGEREEEGIAGLRGERVQIVEHDERLGALGELEDERDRLGAGAPARGSGRGGPVRASDLGGEIGEPPVVVGVLARGRVGRGARAIAAGDEEEPGLADPFRPPDDGQGALFAPRGEPRALVGAADEDLRGVGQARHGGEFRKGARRSATWGGRRGLMGCADGCAGARPC